MDRPSPELIHCPWCGERNSAIDDDCHVCGQGLTLFIGPRPKVRKVSLATVMIGIAVVAVCLAVMREIPPLGILLAVSIVPGAARTVLVVGERKADGRAMTPGETVSAFFASSAISLGIAVASVFTLLVVCLALGGLSSYSHRRPSLVAVFFPWIAASASASFVGCFLVRRLWPRRD